MKGHGKMQKRLWGLVLVTAILIGLLILPAMAADGEDAMDRMSITTSLDGTDNWVKETMKLYEAEMAMQVEQYGYRLIGRDTNLTISAVGTSTDYEVWVNHKWFIMGSNGVYVQADECRVKGCSLRENGEFMNRAISESDDGATGQAVWKLTAGESLTFTGEDLLEGHDIDTENAICMVQLRQNYTENGKTYKTDYWWLCKLDDTKAAELSAQMPDPNQPFTDVASADWFYDDVKYVYENGLMNGTSDTKFSPYSTLTRGMVVTILHRMESEPEAVYSGTFSDVPDGTWYTKGVEWAASVGVVIGYPNGKFGPGDPVTREQLAAILYRYAQYKGYDTTASSDLSGCSDGASVSAYAVSAAQWAVAGKILFTENGKLRPTEAANRAEVAAAMASFHGAYVK